MASSKRSWSLSTLPPELIEEILYRTPAESLVRAKPTCKKWYALITTNRRFIFEHLRRSPQRFIRTVETVQIMDPVTRTRSDSPLPKELHVRMMVHCDGLMLCMSGNSQYRKFNLAIWNPVLRKLRWIKPSLHFTESDYYGIGYDIKMSRYGYKILRFTDRRYDRYGDYDEEDREPEVEMYECKTRSWRTLDAKVGWDVDITCKGVSVVGNMYWFAQKYWVAKKEHRNYILGFDFSVETFKDVCFAPPSRHDNYLACFDGDRLSLLQQDQETTSPIEVWVSSKLAGDGDVLFSKYFSVSRPDLPSLLFHTDMAHPVYCIGKHKRVVAWCEGDVYEGDDDKIPPTCITLYEIDEGGVRTQLETERHYGSGYSGTFLCGYVYVPSLVPLPE
ncbi:putative F-box only protein 15 [Raphanus sativus]|uniref:F-box only protein 15 n=1 Tax=Raphanus sativus TaxID=3726 RepID=A0A6J0JUR3_RAPSA|nr:putative F-box only protein 15 [Raphanus sativus]KAJ4885894.1 putative F-box only protein 15 [Raphanus sativus]